MSHPIAKHTDTERFEARISAHKKSLLKKAAELSGRTLTDFVVHSAYEATVRAIQEYQQLHLSIKDRDIFVQTLLNPPSPNNSLLLAAKKYKKMVTFHRLSRT